MSQEEKPKKRVGSWGEWTAYVFKGVLLNGSGTILLLSGATGVIWTLAMTYMVFFYPYLMPNPVATRSRAIATLFTVLMSGLFFVTIALLGKKAMKGAAKMPFVLPPTRQNTATLLAQDVLVRASFEPSEEAGETLLRATVADGETPATELLRPTSQG